MTREQLIKTAKSILLTAVFFLGIGQVKAQLTQTSSIAGPSNTADLFNNGYTFAYTASGAPWNGALISFGGLVNRYDCQISTDYGPAGGNHISFRTHNGDVANVWNSWKEIWHSGNLNRTDVDFTAKTINSTNIYNNGNLWSKQINVALSIPWADYVFDPGYNLPPLEDVKKFIGKNHHLQDVPSAAEVEKNGINLGEMNMVLLKKVEELTLYLIEQNKQLKEQNKKFAYQQRVNQSLKEQINKLTKRN